jgi:NhaA family Na+:H+ antiporter
MAEPEGRIRADSLPGLHLPRGLREFLHTEALGGAVLVVAAVVALVWANSAWSAGYDSFVHSTVSVEVGPFSLSEDLTHFVNEALMAVFFLVVGLEVKRELVLGELRQWRTAALPAVAAAGGMVVPALVYLAVNLGGEGQSGWGVPMATDIAFALGVVALVGKRVPASLKIFLLTLATVDDIGAIVVIAVFYSGGIQWISLLAAAGLLAAIGGLRALRVRWMPVYVVLGVAVWLAVRAAGVHATLAGVALGLMVPARPLAAASVAREWAEDLSDEPGPDELKTMTTLARSTVSTTERLQHLLHPFVSFFVVPLFALVNAGVALDGDALSGPGAAGVAGGVVLGLLAGKMIGIVGASALAVRFRVGTLPAGVGWGHLVAVSAVAAVGFTVALFIAELAFDDEALVNAAKVGILAASVLAALVGAAALRWACRPGTETPSQPTKGAPG